MGVVTECRPAVRRAFGVVVPAVLLAAAAWSSVGFPTPQHAPVPLAVRAQPPGSASDAHGVEPPWSDGPGTSEPGIYLSAAPDPLAGSTLEVSELVWLTEPVDGVTLRPPSVSVSVSGNAPGLVWARTTAGSVQVTAGGRPVAVGSPVLAAPERIDFAEPTRRFEVRYELTTVLENGSPASVGGGAALAPLSEVASDLPVVVWTSGPGVRTLHCPLLPPELRSCAVAEGSSVRTLPGLRSASALVVVRLDAVGP